MYNYTIAIANTLLRNLPLEAVLFVAHDDTTMPILKRVNVYEPRHSYYVP